MIVLQAEGTLVSPIWTFRSVAAMARLKILTKRAIELVVGVTAGLVVLTVPTPIIALLGRRRSEDTGHVRLSLRISRMRTTSDGGITADGGIGIGEFGEKH